jgi:hypothetical protein
VAGIPERRLFADFSQAGLENLQKAGQRWDDDAPPPDHEERTEPVNVRQGEEKSGKRT